MTTINSNSEAYNTGYEAAVQGEPRTENPYTAGWDRDNWDAGWEESAASMRWRHREGCSCGSPDCPQWQADWIE